MANNDKPRIPAQRGTNGAGVAKSVKTPASFQPEYVNGSLELSGPTNNRPGKLSQYTQDLLVYVGALEKETTGLRDKQSTLNAKITELNGTVTALEQRITTDSDKHQRELTTAKSATRAANATMDAERTRANMAEALEDTRQQIHDLFDGASLSDLSTSRGSLHGSPIRTAFFSCAGLRFMRNISSTEQSLRVWSAVGNPIQLREHVITRFAGNDLHVADKTHLLFLREAVTVEGFELNKQRLSAKELEQLYRMAEMTKVFSCGHNVIEHIKLRKNLLKRYAPEIVAMVFKRLEGGNSTDSHHIELVRAIMIFIGIDEATANISANNEAENNRQLDQAKQQLRKENIDPELVKALGATALGSTLDYELIDLRPENLRRKPSEALHLIQEQDGPLYHGTPGLYGGIKPIISELNRGRGLDNEPSTWSRFREFTSGQTHDLGTDGLYDSPSGEGCTDGRPAIKDLKPDHSGDCRNNGLTEGCTHESHQPKQG